MSHLRDVPNRSDPITPSRTKPPAPGQGRPVFTPKGSYFINKSKKKPRPCGRGRRIECPKSAPAPLDIPLPFLKFSAEVRNIIYGYLLTFEKDLILMDHRHADCVRQYGRCYAGGKRNSLKGKFRHSYDDEGNSILEESELISSYNQKNLSFIDRSILLVNKQIYNEARGSLIANNALRVMYIDLEAMKPARWETMRQFTHFYLGMYEEALPTMIELLCSTHYDLTELAISMVIPSAEGTRCQYWVQQMKDILEPLRCLHVRGQVAFEWIQRHLVDNPEVQKETVEWLEKLAIDMMGGPGDRKQVVIGEEMDKESVDIFAAHGM